MAMQDKQRILITGGAGFIGSQLGYVLEAEGHEVLLLDNMRYGYLDNLIVNGKSFGKFYGRDIRDASIQSLFSGVDIVVHLAGIAPLPVCQSDPSEALDVNVTGTVRVLECARKAGVKRVFFSSTSAVYEQSKLERHKESEEVAPNLVYATTKYSAEQFCKGFAQNYNMDIVIGRFFNVYGPHQDMLRTSPPFTSYIARELSNDRVPTLFNNSNAKRDYIHTQDLIELLKLMLFSSSTYRGEIFNLASGVGFSVPELYDIFLKTSGKNIVPTYKDPQAFWDNYPELFEGGYKLSRERVKEEVYKHAIADIAKVKQHFNWSPKVSIESGIRSVYEYAQAKAGGLRC